MKCLRTEILVKPLETESVTIGGIIVPESYKKRSNKAIVVETGIKVKQLKKGMIVFNIKDCGEEYIINGEKHYIMLEQDVLAILN
jgi:chaperonin GroES